MADILYDCNFHQVLASKVVISSVEASLNGHVGMGKTVPIDFQTLAAWWMVSPECTQRTVQRTTQQGVCTCLNPALAQHVLTNHQKLCHKCLPHMTFTDTHIAGATFQSGNKCSQVYATSFGWARAHPMTRKGEAHETLSLLFQRDGVPQTILFDDSKDQSLGKFRYKWSWAVLVVINT
jgi:hypothetical protein